MEDIADMRAAAEGQLLALLQRGITVRFVSESAAELSLLTLDEIDD
ncbi:hypothetical protein [Gemmatimonas sp.]